MFIKVQVLDNEEEIVSVTGKGHAVIPAFYFLSNETILSSHCKYCILYLIILFTEGYTVTLGKHIKYYFIPTFSVIYRIAS